MAKLCLWFSAIILPLQFIPSPGGGTKNPTARWDNLFLDTLQRRTFGYFWDLANPRNGLVPDRFPTPCFSSIAAVGFALTSYPIGVERKYVTRAEAAERVLATLRFFWAAPQSANPDNIAGYKGFFYHFLDMNTGHRFGKVELSTIDTGLLLGGVLMCESYFDRGTRIEKEIRAYADSIFLRVDWQWAVNNPPLLSMGWHPESGFIKDDWRGFNEAMILYILGLGSPTHPIEPEAWKQWTSGYIWAKYYGYEFVSFGPLFGHQYSHCWIDFRGIQDEYMKSKGIDYFENSRRATLTHQLYAMDNRDGWRGYGKDIWGLTACDGPGDTSFIVDGKRRKFYGYDARGVSFDWSRDDGAIAPTAAGGSVAFAPEICIPALKAIKQTYGGDIWKEYGFIDSFDPTFLTSRTPHGWFDVDYLGIDQGPIIIMAENLRSGLIWNTMRKNKYIVRGLQRAGFTGGWLESADHKK